MGSCASHPEPPPLPEQFAATERCAALLLGGAVTIEAKLGEGATGCVYLARWQEARVAIKVTRESRSEASLSLTLRHPHVVSTFLAKTYQGQLWIVQEHCHLGSLRDFLRRDKGRAARGRARMTNQQRVRIATGVASGMLYLAGQGVVHGDLNCNNVLLTRVDDELCAKVADFGIARNTTAWGCSHRFTETQGTLSHVAPELMREGKLSAAVDVYAFGILLHELFTGTAAYGDLLAGQIIVNLATGNRPTFPADTHVDVTSLARRCWQDAPHARPGWTEILACLTQIQF